MHSTTKWIHITVILLLQWQNKRWFLWVPAFEFRLQHDYGLGLSYHRMDTKAPTEYYSNGIKKYQF